ncbi:hypothetical protein M501DRAFT_1028917 [Patellaria atrata CBS 101060]|uniref:Uncharacterized protein n=1 Tax=Patellaria atrata CBS 101060 TaxID=1346257 RepID=A0A9P4SGB1_9PEZI|nr:hypothetical protein M501DRAFT_1028917 [Patellaria atrata CBS 101060]
MWSGSGGRVHFHDPASTWKRKFIKRQPQHVYSQQDEQRLKFDPRTTDALVFEFLKTRGTRLDPSDSPQGNLRIQYAALGEYMRLAKLEDLETGSPTTITGNDVAMMNDRKDIEGSNSWPRAWDSEGPRGYMNYPTPGEHVVNEIYNMHDFFQKLRENRQDNGAEKRNIYTANVTPTCMIAIASTAPDVMAPALRSFFHRHLLARALFRSSLSSLSPRYALEFHIPYFALRRGAHNEDRRRFRNGLLRKSRPLPLARNEDERNEMYHEAQTSFLVTGVDEWLWTSYCFVDTFYGSEPDERTYIDGGIDPASGGSIWVEFPIWNPRQYYLMVFARRMMQSTREWGALINVFEERMAPYEESTIVEFFDDEHLTRTRELTVTISTIRKFRDCIRRTVAAWENFETNDLPCFEVSGSDEYKETWREYISDVRGHVDDLRSMHLSLHQKFDLFNGLKDGIVSASTLKESGITRELGRSAAAQNIQIATLTRMTVV